MDQSITQQQEQKDTQAKAEKRSVSKELKQEKIRKLLIKKPYTRDELCEAFLEAYSDDDKYSKLSKSNISKFIKEDSTGRVFESDSENGKVLSYIADYNGIDCVAMHELQKAQREYKIFPIPYIYSIRSTILLIEVNPRYVGYAKDLLAKMLTQRYLYEATSFSNQVVLFLMGEKRSINFNKACKNESVGRYPCIDLEEYDTDYPLLEGLKTNTFLTPKKIKELLLKIMDEEENEIE